MGDNIKDADGLAENEVTRATLVTTLYLVFSLASDIAGDAGSSTSGDTNPHYLTIGPSNCAFLSLVRVGQVE